MTRPIAVLDAETDPFRLPAYPGEPDAARVPRPFAWGFYDGVEYRQWWGGDVAGVIAFLSEYDGIVYAHNGGRFDYHYLLDGLEAFSELMIVNGRLTRFNIGAAEMRDSFTILPVGLAKYKKDEIDYSIFVAGERDKPANRRKIERYLRADCVYLHEFVSGFVERYGLVLTCPGAALKQWEKICDVRSPRTDAEFYSTFAPFYYGGRVECFESGVIDAKFSVFDINSAYPRAMKEKHPMSPNFESARRYLKNADFVRVRGVSHGALPFRGLGDPGEIGTHDKPAEARPRYGAGLNFPNDNEVREYTVTGWEYRTAMDTGTLTDAKVLESFRFCTHGDFGAFVDHFYAMRVEAKRTGDVAADIFAKLLQNGLYGKMASNPANYRNYMVFPPEHANSMAGSGWEAGGVLGPWVLGEAPLAEHQQRYYNVATGASITGWVRAYLWRAVLSCEGVLYVDTDSIAARAATGSLTVGGGLGEWKHEGDFDAAGIGGKKLYVFRGVPGSDPKAADGRKWKTASKGVRLSRADLWRVAAGEVVEYMPEAPTYSPRKAPVFTPRTVVKTA